jgi:hypothetical protein
MTPTASFYKAVAAGAVCGAVGGLIGATVTWIAVAKVINNMSKNTVTVSLDILALMLWLDLVI